MFTFGRNRCSSSPEYTGTSFGPTICSISLSLRRKPRSLNSKRHSFLHDGSAATSHRMSGPEKSHDMQLLHVRTKSIHQKNTIQYPQVAGSYAHATIRQYCRYISHDIQKFVSLQSIFRTWGIRRTRRQYRYCNVRLFARQCVQEYDDILDVLI